jgi:hypothetical protein
MAAFSSREWHKRLPAYTTTFGWINANDSWNNSQETMVLNARLPMVELGSPGQT